jgi:hypothetical protein
MTTAAEYRERAHECVEAARHAQSAEERNELLDLAVWWMTAAERADRAGQPFWKDDAHTGPYHGHYGVPCK